MSTTPAVPELNQVMPPMPEKQQGQDPTADDPNKQTPEQSAEAIQLTDAEKQQLMWLRRDYKMSWAIPRRAKIKSVLKAFEILKGNPYISFDPDSFSYYDPFDAAGSSVKDMELYKFNNNVYQMLALSFMAALSPQVPKVRYMPEDADEEQDIATARRASTMMAIVERKNNVKSLQKQELLHLWTGGCYFSYTRYVIDGDRAGTTKQPVVEPVDTQVTPDRFVCPECGNVQPADQSTFTKPICEQCGYKLGEEDFYPSESLPIPQEVGKEDVPNGMVMTNVYGAINIDCDPDSEDLFETPILDLEVEADIAAVRASYPEAWTKLKATEGADDTPEGGADRLARLQAKSPAGASVGTRVQSKITYSRCWIQSWAFNHIEDKALAEGLKAKFPQGCKLVSAGGNEFLEAVPAKLTESWTWCGTVRGIGLYPFAVGAAALDVQDRINDVANKIHEYMDRSSSPTILVDADVIDEDAMNGMAMLPGAFTMVKRKGAGAQKSLADIMWQPQFHQDANIYQYGESLVQLAQLVSGVLPQVFGGSDNNVKTFGGQKQQLNTALGKLGLFWDQIREEHANRAENSVRCFANNMGDKVRNVIDGDTESGFSNEYILLTEMQGSFHAYPESDQGFPATYAEIRDLLVEMLGQTNNPFVQALMSDSDNVDVIMRYVAPPDVHQPGKAARTKIKRLLDKLSKGQPFEVQPEEAMAIGIVTDAPLLLPQTETGYEFPDKDFDKKYYLMFMDECDEWAQKHWEMETTNPSGYNNVRAFKRLLEQYAQAAQAREMVVAAQEQAKALPSSGGTDPSGTEANQLAAEGGAGAPS